ncbi:hypothetical protein [Streptomyces avermitilis]|uniref:hypothetical protein n=1 Tax=Streptomyces avermitilis TaxID=33903 RepID=UPI0038283F87
MNTSNEQVNERSEAADRAHRHARDTAPREHAAWLRAIASALDEHKGELVAAQALRGAGLLEREMFGPATTAAATASVGTAAIGRFMRPVVAYDSFPQEQLPPPLRDDNPWRITRRVDGQWRSTDGGQI